MLKVKDKNHELMCWTMFNMFKVSNKDTLMTSFHVVPVSFLLTLNQPNVAVKIYLFCGGQKHSQS